MSATSVVSYDSQWPSLFEQERQRLEVVLEAFGPIIEHVGSTSVEGLAAKPTIDFSIGLKDQAALDCTGEERWKAGSTEGLEPQGSDTHKKMVEAVCSLGYQYRGEHGIPGRPFFAKDVNGARLCNLHVTALDHYERRQQIGFRDYLRKHPDLVIEYARIKQEASKLHPSDMAAYTEHKDPFIKKILSEILA